MSWKSSGMRKDRVGRSMSASTDSHNRCSTIAVIVAIALAVPAFLIAGIFISIGYSIVGWLYIASSREVKRIGTSGCEA